jgi:N-acetylneuraminate synthase
LYVQIGDHKVGSEHPPFLVAELGINFALDHPDKFLDNTVQMIRLAKMSGAMACKFQKRTPRICVPRDQWDKPRETPWGMRTYIEYKEDIEFNGREYDTISHVCKEEGILWFASVWDEESLDFIEQYNPPCYKIGSASLTDDALLKKVRKLDRPMILSTGMSTDEEIDHATWLLRPTVRRVIVCHSTSIYPCPLDKLNLSYISVLREQYGDPVGYSGHERGVHVTPAAVALGASYIERHFTLDRNGWGTDQAASIEHWQFKDMADRIMETWMALGDGMKQVYPEEQEKMASLRRVPVANT